MKRFRFFLISAVLFAAGMTAYGQDHPFQAGEKCTYKLHYKWGLINADIAQLDFAVQEETYKGTPCYHLVTRGSTTKFVSNLIKVDYFYDSRFAKSDLLPLAFYREQTEGSYWAKNTYSWTNSGKTLRAVVDKSNRGLRDTVITAKDVIYDAISMLYAVRSSDLDRIKNNGGKLHLVTAMDRNIYDVWLSYIKSEEKKSSEMGTFMTDKFCMNLRCRPGGVNLAKESALTVSSTDDGKLAPIYLWTSPGEDKTILFFSTALPVGSVNGRVTSISGSKHPVKPVK